jgi:acyl transferase domain-containing protein
MLFGEYIRLMALVEYSADEIKTVFSDYPDLEVCVYAAPTQTVIGGPPDQVDAIVARAEAEGVEMDDDAPDLESLIADFLSGDWQSSAKRIRVGYRVE